MSGLLRWSVCWCPHKMLVHARLGLVEFGPGWGRAGLAGHESPSHRGLAEIAGPLGSLGWNAGVSRGSARADPGADRVS